MSQGLKFSPTITSPQTGASGEKPVYELFTVFMVNEIWVPVSEYEGLYEVSNIARVRKVSNQKLLTTCFLDGKKGLRGSYLRCYLRKDNKGRAVLLHRLVYCSFNKMSLKFLGQKTKTLVCHKDDNPENNNLDNLFIGDRNDNFNDMMRKGRWLPKLKHGEDVNTNVLKESTVYEIRKNYVKMLNNYYREISAKHGTSTNNIREICDGTTWKHVKFWRSKKKKETQALPAV